MAVIRQDADLDLLKNSLLNVVLQKGSTATINALLTVAGQVGYDTTKLREVIFDGTTVQSLLQINDIVTSITAGSTNATIPSTLSVFNAIQSAVASGQLAITAFDASGTTFPAGATLANRYRVTVAGTVQGIILAVGDVFFPAVASPSPTSAADWAFVQANVDSATSTVLGLVFLATLADIQGNTAPNANKAVTVATLNSFLSSFGYIRRYESPTPQAVVVGTNTVTHNLNSLKPSVESFDSVGPIIYQWLPATLNTITFVATMANAGVTFTVDAK